MNVPDIIKVKEHLDELKGKGLINEWELPYENLLTRLTAAVFFLETVDESKLEEIWKELDKHPRLAYRKNEEKKLSQLEWRVEFNKNFEL
ncbi:MAG: hypothetical protein HON76_11575 [Candidatus Scalindua sp.]|jgi:hypothetical protein|nr:hypothetical protein [Candidatus Scalindua sp.]MBT5307613.1 hypothetical protein [Candidatus Scalindua sp.]MBT6050841.1 hypothetical protein [Candidatus Scalindua sp.]MBT6563152.1 hypothetical protein [Candidatus Scalindua sp.]MBT7212673.1 hypothetical protein [Candidatus Scalindua sp.]